VIYGNTREEQTMATVTGQSTPSGFDPGGGTPIKFGVWGDSGDGDGVIGSSGRPGATGPAGATPGGAGVLGLNDEFQGVGVQGRANADTGTAVLGQSEQGTGVAGRSGGSNPGVAGASTTGPGVAGTSDQGPGISGTSDHAAGVLGSGSGSGQSGVEGTSDAGTGVTGTSKDGTGVLGTSGHPERFGVGIGEVPPDPPGVMGIGVNGSGVYAYSLNGAGVTAIGDKGIVASNALFLLSGHGGFPGDVSVAGDFFGDVHVRGALTKASGGFRVDHPLDAENRYLAHSFVESPEMKNVYDGVVTLDGDGQATVELPTWFEALNGTFRYQLTPIGAPGPNLHISRQLADNRFTIAGGTPGMEVSWQVTGVRRDAWALANPLVVEQDKSPQERGYYLHPQAHGQPADRSLASVRYPELSRLHGRPDQG